MSTTFADILARMKQSKGNDGEAANPKAEHMKRFIDAVQAGDHEAAMDALDCYHSEPDGDET